MSQAILRTLPLLLCFPLLQCGDTVPTGAPSDEEESTIDVPRPLTAIEGTWLLYDVGNATDYAYWYSFRAPSTFQQTIATYVFGMGESVPIQNHGTYELDQNGLLTLEWEDELGQTQLNAFTVTIVDSHDQWLPDRFLTTERGLNTMAYAPTGEPSTWRREVRRTGYAWEGNTYEQHHTITLSFESPLMTEASETLTCQMTVDFDVTYDSDDALLHGQETFVLPCHYVEVQGDNRPVPWLQITADGFESSTVNGTWGDYLTENGVFERYGPEINMVLHEGFRPVVYIALGNDNSGSVETSNLFHNVYWAWMTEVLDSPPAPSNGLPD